MPEDTTNTMFALPGAIINNGDIKGARIITNHQDSALIGSITENVAHAWYEGSGSHHPWEGETKPHYTDFEDSGKYSWCKPGDIYRYEKEDFMLGRLPIKMSPHQIGIQEVLTLSDLRDRCPDKVSLFGIIPQSYDAGVELSQLLSEKLPGLAELVVGELEAAGHLIIPTAQ